MACSVFHLGKIPLQTYRPSNRSLFPYICPNLKSVSYDRRNLEGVLNKCHFKELLFCGKSVSCHPVKLLPSYSSEDINPFNEEPLLPKRNDDFKQWDSTTAKFAGAANLPFLLLQLPQIVLNARNLLAGNKSALLAVPWMGMLTGLLGNLSLSSYFIKKKETEAVVVQTLGVISTYIVMLQLAMGEAMPLPHFIITSAVVAYGLLMNFFKYFNMLKPEFWRFWEDFITVAGLSTLSQVMWSTLVPYVPNSILPGILAFIASFSAVIMGRLGKLSKKGVEFLGSISGWTATLLFMWMAVAQMLTNLVSPDNIKGLSAISMLLAMIGNGLMLPRALFIRDLMWFTGSGWGSIFYGWGNLICLYCFDCISKEFFIASTTGFLCWMGLTFWRDAQAHGLASPLKSLKELVLGR